MNPDVPAEERNARNNSSEALEQPEHQAKNQAFKPRILHNMEIGILVRNPRDMVNGIADLS